jgi:hypothetical protein
LFWKKVRILFRRHSQVSEFARGACEFFSQEKSPSHPSREQSSLLTFPYYASLVGEEEHSSNGFHSSYFIEVAGEWQGIGGIVRADGGGDESGLMSENKSGCVFAFGLFEKKFRTPHKT